MQVKIMFSFEKRTFTCITDTQYGSYAGKNDVFFWRIAVLPGKTLKSYTLRPTNCENRLPRSAGEDPEDLQETPRPSQGRQMETQRRFQEPSGRPFGSHLGTFELLFRQKSMICRHF